MYVELPHTGYLISLSPHGIADWPEERGVYTELCSEGLWLEDLSQ